MVLNEDRVIPTLDFSTFVLTKKACNPWPGMSMDSGGKLVIIDDEWLQEHKSKREKSKLNAEATSFVPCTPPSTPLTPATLSSLTGTPTSVPESQFSFTKSLPQAAAQEFGNQRNAYATTTDPILPSPHNFNSSSPTVSKTSDAQEDPQAIQKQLKALQLQQQDLENKLAKLQDNHQETSPKKQRSKTLHRRRSTSNVNAMLPIFEQEEDNTNTIELLSSSDVSSSDSEDNSSGYDAHVSESSSVAHNVLNGSPFVPNEDQAEQQILGLQTFGSPPQSPPLQHHRLPNSSSMSCEVFYESLPVDQIVLMNNVQADIQNTQHLQVWHQEIARLQSIMHAQSAATSSHGQLSTAENDSSVLSRLLHLQLLVAGAENANSTTQNSRHYQRRTHVKPKRKVGRGHVRSQSCSVDGVNSVNSVDNPSHPLSFSPKGRKALTKREINKELLEKRYAHMLKDEVVKPEKKLLRRKSSTEAFPVLGEVQS